MKFLDKIYIIDLDKDASERWNEVVDDHIEQIRWINENFHLLAPFPGVSGACKLVSAAASLRLVLHSDELVAISQRAGINLGKLVFLQFLYEACAACTSVVLEREGVPFLTRTVPPPSRR